MRRKVNNDGFKAPPCSICQAKPPLYICHQAKSHGAHAKAGWSHDNFFVKALILLSPYFISPMIG